MTPLDLLWLFFIISSLQPLFQQRVLASRRLHTLRTLEKRHGGFIDIDDSEAVIRAIEMTSEQVPIQLVLHTPGGLVLAAEQIASALVAHPAKITVYVPHYAMSGGTLIALAADTIVLAPSAVLGPIDPQLGEYPAASILHAIAQKDPNEIDDKTLILADLSRKAQIQVRDFAAGLLRRQLPAEQADELAQTLSEGRWTHDFPITVELARTLGLTVSADLPNEVRELMGLYPQPRGRRPSVEYIPVPYRPAERSERGRPINWRRRQRRR